MRIRVTMPIEEGKRLRDKVIETAESIESDKTGQEDWDVVSYKAYSCPCHQPCLGYAH